MNHKGSGGGKPVGLPLADLLYLRRKQMGLTQGEVAERLQQEAIKAGIRSGTTIQLIHRYEMGDTLPRAKNLDWLATSLNLAPEMLRDRARQQSARLGGATAAIATPVADSRAGELDRERLHAVLAGTRVDKQSLDQLAILTENFMRESWSAGPRSLLPAVIGHFSGFGNILLGVPPALSTRAHSMAGEVAFLAGYLLLKSGLRADTDFFWQTSERIAQSAGDIRLQSILFTIRGWQARDEAPPERAVAILDKAQSLLGGSPNPMGAALTYSSRAYDLAAAGRGQAATRDIESAEHYLGRRRGENSDLYMLESIRDEVDIARGWHLFHLRQYEDSAETFERILDRIDPSWKTQQANILAHLGSVYAQKGDTERSCHIFSSALNMAREAAAPRYEQMTVNMRQRWLGNNDSPAIQRLDEEFTAG